MATFSPLRRSGPGLSGAEALRGAVEGLLAVGVGLAEALDSFRAHVPIEDLVKVSIWANRNRFGLVRWLYDVAGSMDQDGLARMAGAMAENGLNPISVALCATSFELAEALGRAMGVPRWLLKCVVKTHGDAHFPGTPFVLSLDLNALALVAKEGVVHMEGDLILPHLRVVGGDRPLVVECSEMMVRGGVDLGGTRGLCLYSLVEVGGNLSAAASVGLRLPLLTRVGGALDLDASLGVAMAVLERVGGTVWANTSRDAALPKLGSIGGSLVSCESRGLALPSLMTIGGHLDLSDSEWTVLPSLQDVGGRILDGIADLGAVAPSLRGVGGLPWAHSPRASLNERMS